MDALVAQVVFEAPPGLKKNLQRTYTLWSSDFLAGCLVAPGAAAATPSKGGSGGYEVAALTAPALVPLRAQLLFLLAWFNAVVQERRNYVPYVSRCCWQATAPVVRTCV
jgi:dynein heavy chain 2